jgi:hypothetical protein
VDVTVTDGQGGSVNRFVDIAVTPSSTDVNVARSAVASASTENSGRGQGVEKAIDGVASGYPNDPTAEWSSVGEVAGAWVQLDWSAGQTISRIVLHDRINSEDQVLSGTLTFSDGSVLAVDTLPNDGSALSLNFTARSVTWVRFTVNSGRGSNIGLAEFEVY